LEVSDFEAVQQPVQERLPGPMYNKTSNLVTKVREYQPKAEEHSWSFKTDQRHAQGVKKEE